MSKRSKRYLESRKIVDSEKKYELKEAVKLLKSFKLIKFDESVEVAMKLGIDPKQSDQLVRGSVSLPKGIGRSLKVVVFAAGEKATVAKKAGADPVKVVEAIRGGAAQCVSLALERIVGVFEGAAHRQIVLQLANALQGIIAQELLPAVDRSRRVLAYELLVSSPAVRNLIRENNLHQLENCIQTGACEGMVLMDACLYDLYARCLISYDTAISRARNPDRFAKRAG